MSSSSAAVPPNAPPLATLPAEDMHGVLNQPRSRPVSPGAPAAPTPPLTATKSRSRLPSLAEGFGFAQTPVPAPDPASFVPPPHSQSSFSTAGGSKRLLSLTAPSSRRGSAFDLLPTVRRSSPSPPDQSSLAAMRRRSYAPSQQRTTTGLTQPSYFRSSMSGPSPDRWLAPRPPVPVPPVLTHKPGVPEQGSPGPSYPSSYQNLPSDPLYNSSTPPSPTPPGAPRPELPRWRKSESHITFPRHQPPPAPYYQPPYPTRINWPQLPNLPPGVMPSPAGPPPPRPPPNSAQTAPGPPRPFACHQCGAAFVRNHDLRR